MQRSIKVRVVKETGNKVTLYFINLNRKMPVSKEEFEARVADGLYEVIK